MRGWLDTALSTIILLQQIIQGRWFNDHPLLCLPHTSLGIINSIGRTLTIPQLQDELAIHEINGQPNEKQRRFLESTIARRCALESRQVKEVGFWLISSFV